MKGFHFLQADMTAGSGDEAPWEIGEKRTIADPSKILLCRYGYHSSPSLWDALPYACGPMACLVEISKPVASDDEANHRKAVSASRKLIKAVNIDRELRLFACDCEERVLHMSVTTQAKRRVRRSKSRADSPMGKPLRRNWMRRRLRRGLRRGLRKSNGSASTSTKCSATSSNKGQP